MFLPTLHLLLVLTSAQPRPVRWFISPVLTQAFYNPFNSSEVFAVSPADRSIYIWDPSTGIVVDDLPTQGAAVAMPLPPDGSEIVIGDTQAFSVLRRSNKTVSGTFVTNTSVEEMATNADGSMVVTGGRSATLRVFFTKPLAMRASFAGAGLTAISFQMNSSDSLVGGDANGFMWKGNATSTFSKGPKIANGLVSSLSISKHDGLVLVASEAGDLTVWNVTNTTNNQLDTISTGGVGVAAAAWSPHIPGLGIAGLQDGACLVFYSDGSQPLRFASGVPFPVAAVSFHPSDPDAFVTAHANGTIIVWSLATSVSRTPTARPLAPAFPTPTRWATAQPLLPAPAPTTPTEPTLAKGQVRAVVVALGATGAAVAVVGAALLLYCKCSGRLVGCCCEALSQRHQSNLALEEQKRTRALADAVASGNGSDTSHPAAGSSACDNSEDNLEVDDDDDQDEDEDEAGLSGAALSSLPSPTTNPYVDAPNYRLQSPFSLSL